MSNLLLFYDAKFTLFLRILGIILISNFEFHRVWLVRFIFGIGLGPLDEIDEICSFKHLELRLNHDCVSLALLEHFLAI